MIIDDLNGVGVPVAPLKTDAPLVVDANTVLSNPITLQFLQPASRQRPESEHVRRRVEKVQLPECLPLNGLEAANRFPTKEPLGLRTAEGADHFLNLYCSTLNVNKYRRGRQGAKDGGNKASEKDARLRGLRLALQLLQERRARVSRAPTTSWVRLGGGALGVQGEY